jgi:two-component sensor histidine kinase
VAVLVDAPDDLRLDPNVTVPLALIVAEAVSNAIEHGLPECAGTIRVRLAREGGGLCLQIADDGRGVAPDFQIGREQTSLGLRIANALAAQLGGRFALLPGEGRGAVARLDLPATAER